MASNCPYCRVALTTVPRRRTKCRSCGEPIVVRSRQDIFPSALLTLDQAWAVAAIAAIENVFARPFSVTIGSPPATHVIQPAPRNEGIRALTRELGETPGALRQPLAAAYKAALTDATLHQAKMAWYQWGLLEAAAGRPHLDAAREARRFDLLDCRESAGRMQLSEVVEIRTAGPPCSACATLEGRRISISEALAQMPIPCLSCTTELHTGARGFCRCWYQLVLEF